MFFKNKSSLNKLLFTRLITAAALIGGNIALQMGDNFSCSLVLLNENSNYADRKFTKP